VSPDDPTPVTSDTNAATPTPRRTRRASDTASITDAVTATLVSTTATGWPSATPPISAEDLFSSAQRHAVRAFRARASDDHPDAALQFGVMLEHLAKAFLVGLHPTLLLERNFDFPTLLLLAGQGQRVKPGHVLKTIGLRVALERIGEMKARGAQGAGKAFANQFDTVVQARDGVVHVGAHSGGVDDVAQSAIQAATEILRLMNRSDEEFFTD
jgi:hypothetical protein